MITTKFATFDSIADMTWCPMSPLFAVKQMILWIMLTAAPWWTTQQRPEPICQKLIIFPEFLTVATQFKNDKMQIFSKERQISLWLFCISEAVDHAGWLYHQQWVFYDKLRGGNAPWWWWSAKSYLSLGRIFIQSPFDENCQWIKMNCAWFRKGSKWLILQRKNTNILLALRDNQVAILRLKVFLIWCKLGVTPDLFSSRSKVHSSSHPPKVMCSCICGQKQVSARTAARWKQGKCQLSIHLVAAF